MVDYLILILLIALFSAFIISLLKKVGIIEWLQIHGSELISKLAHCDFCLSWWMNVIVSVTIALALGNWIFLLVPFFSTMITRFIL